MSDSHAQRWKLVWFFLTWLTFGLLPLSLFFLLARHTLSLAEEGHRKSLCQDLEREFHSLRHETSPLVYCGRRFAAFRRAAGPILRRSPSSDALPRLIERFQRNSPLRFDPYCFDDAGRLITPASVPLANRFALQRVWDFLNAPAEEATGHRLRLGKIFRTVFGGETSLSVLREGENRLLEIRSRRRDGFLWWNRTSPGSRAGLLLVAWRLPAPLTRVAAYRRTLAAKGLFLLVPDRNRRWHLFGRSPLPGLAADLRRLRLQRETTLLSGRRLLWRGEAEGTPFYLGRPLPAGWPYPSWQAALTALFLLLSLLSGGVYGAGMLTREGFRLPIRFRLIALFLFSLSIPSAGVAFLGSRLLGDRREVLQAEAEHRARKDLHALDARFQAQRADLLARYRSILEAVRGGTPPAALTASLTTMLSEHRLQHFEVRNIHGDPIVTPGSQTRMEGLDYFFESFARVCMARCLTDRLQGPEGKGFRPPDPMANDIITSGEIGMGGMAATLDILHHFQLAGTDVFLYWNVLREVGHPAAYVLLVQSAPAEERAFLSRLLEPAPGAEAAPPLFALARSAEWGFPHTLRPGLPWRALFEQAVQTGQPVRGRIFRQGLPSLAVGQPGKHLRGHILFALLPEENIDRAVGFLRGGLAVCLGGALLVALLLGSELANHFLHPIRDLHRGMLALQKRDVTYRVPVTSSDEFGELAQTFNWMIEDLKEMELARIVQVSLIPAELPAVPGFRMAMRNLVATDLGGDYCDALPLPDGRFLVVIGDVTGHGVGAALGMTLVKALVFQFAQEGGPLTTLLERLNRAVLQAFHRRKLMTFLAAILDGQTGEFIFANAGHIFPLLLPANGGKPRELAQMNFLLGAMDRKFAPKEETVIMHPGDRLFLCTDGLLEGMDPQEEMFGFQRVQEFLSSSSSDSPDGQCDRLLEDYFSFRQERLLPDDLTMLLIRREEKGSFG